MSNKTLVILLFAVALVAFMLGVIFGGSNCS